MSEESVADVPACPPMPPAADIPGALAKTEHALGAMSDSDRFERIAVACLERYVPALRNTGGSGDEQRDGVGGSLTADGDQVVLTVSLDRSWAKKVERDLDGLAKHGHKPELVIAATNRKTGAKRRNELQKDTREKRRHKLKIIDVKFLALRLLSTELLTIREELLGLPVPQLPVAVHAAEFARRQPNTGAPERMIGRAKVLDALVALMEAHVTVEVIGPGGIGKTRLALEADTRIDADRTLFLDDRARLDSDLLSSELAGADQLTLVVDNAHRCEGLRQVVGLLSARTGPTRLILVARPGYEERLRQAIEGTPFGAPGMTGRLLVEGLGNKEIGEMVRAAKPSLEFEGAIERIVELAAGNPLIALLAHRVASSRGGLHGLAFNDLLGEYSRSAVATAVERRTDVQADDLHDVLTVVAALGPVGPSDESLISSLLGVPVRTVRHRTDDLADVGLLTASGEQFGISPDLLAAHILQQTHLSGRKDAGVRYEEIWQAADEGRRDAMCAALGALQGFDVTGGTEVSALVGDALADLASVSPMHALTRAQSVAPGLPEIAVRTVDVAITALPEDADSREKALLTAMDVLSRVPDISDGWPRQLKVAQAFFAVQGTDTANKGIYEALTRVYKRLPINTSVYDGHVLAHVQDVLTKATVAHWEEHRDEPGCARTIAAAAGQLLTVVAEQTYASAEDDMSIKLSGGFVPAAERTSRALRTGSRLLRASLPNLELDVQQRAVAPIAKLRRTVLGASGPFGATPSEDLVTLIGEVIEEMNKEFAELDELPLPTRAALISALGSNPWPDDDDLGQFRELLDFPSARERIEDRGGRAAGQAAVLLTSEDLVVELGRWETWLALAQQAGMRHAAHMVIEPALASAASTDPDRMAQALETVLADGGPLADHAAGALREFAGRPDGETLIHRLAARDLPSMRVAVARGLVGTSEVWGDLLLERLADDGDDNVRSAVAWTAGWTRGGSVGRLRTGLRACLPAGVGDALAVLAGAESRSQEDHLLPLDEAAASTVAELAMNAAREPHIDGYELTELGHMAAQPRLVIEACLARIRWLAENPAEDFAEMMAREGLPDELADAARAGAEDRDRSALTGLLEDPAFDRDARGDATKLLAWIDDHDAITDRLAEWLAGDDERMHYYASELLRRTRDADQFKARARALLATTSPLDLTDVLLDAREPTWLTGSEKVVFRTLVDEFAGWTDDDDERLAAVGRIGVDRFRKRSESADGAEDDDDTEWG